MVAGQSILDVLSPEVVELVVQEVSRNIVAILCIVHQDLFTTKSKYCDPKGFPTLRLVCKALNEFVEPKVFSTATIQFEKDDSEKWKSIPEFLSSLASGTSPYVRWAKDLLVIHLVPNQYDETTTTIGQVLTSGERRTRSAKRCSPAKKNG
jgi:hypothetical protein